MAEPTPSENQTWGGSRAIARHLGRVPWADVLVALAVSGILLAAVFIAQEFGKRRLPDQETAIHLDVPHLALYTLYSLARGLIAYVFSLAFAISYGYWAAKDRVAEKVLLPLLDILQSIPVLAFMPGLMLSLVYLFPRSEVGLNLASILLIFTGQAWNMVFSFYHSMKTVPPEFYEVGQVYRFGWWRRFSRIELPFGTVGLVWNSMMSMAGGWFFLMVCEAFPLGEHKFRLLGLGSYMSEAQDQGDYTAMAGAVVAMVLMIVIMNQLLWRPVAVWAQRFKVEDVASGPREESPVLEWLHRSRLLALVHATTIGPVRRLLDTWDLRHPVRAARAGAPSRLVLVLRALTWVTLLAAAGWGLYLLLALLSGVRWTQWPILFEATAMTLLRVMAAVGLGTLVMVPLGVMIGLRPRLAAKLQPVIQVAASFPAPMLFALFLIVFDRLGLSLGWGSILCMLAGTQWYILFNVVGGARAIPSDLHEAAAICRWRLATCWKRLYLPAIFPFLVTGWVTAAGGAWNTSIVAEYGKVAGHDEPGGAATPAATNAAAPSRAEELLGETAAVDPRVREAFGIGAIINQATERERYALLAGGAVLMALTVVLINRLLWHRLASMAERRFSLSR
jgi:NitT/TauT family transport system permease protein